VKGLRSGEADRDRDGLIGVQELYDYVYEELRDAGVRQRPQMWAELEHRVVVARSALPALPPGPGPGPRPGGGEPAPAPAPTAPVPAVPEPAPAPVLPRPRPA